jgi:hypothetical protein
MTTMQEKSHKWVYIIIAVVIVALMVAGVVLYQDQEQSKEAQAKAKEFIAKLNAAGMKAPSEETAVRLFGVDGGPFAKNPDQTLLQSQYAWQLGTAGPASRPVILDPDFAKAAEIFISVYAPDKLADFQQFVDGLKTEETQ